MANFIERTLEQGEEVVFQGRLHWTYNWKWTCCGVILTILGVLGMLSNAIFTYNQESGDGGGVYILCILAIIIGIAMIGWGYFIRSKTEFAITGSRFIQKDGIFNIKMTEIPLFKVETVNFYQTLFQRMLGTGTIELVGSGGTSHQVHYVQEPFKVRNLLTTLMKENKGKE